ncbi:MAG: hypothetical protein ACJ70W_02860, partial [Nitrososphaera sp.]
AEVAMATDAEGAMETEAVVAMATEAEVAMATEAEVAMAMSIAAKDIMIMMVVEEVLEATGPIGARPDMVEIEDVVDMAPAVEAMATSSSHTVFKTHCLSIF